MNTSYKTHLSTNSFNRVIASINKSSQSSKNSLHRSINVQQLITFAESKWSSKRQNGEILPIMLNYLSSKNVNTRFLIDVLHTSIRFIQNSKDSNMITKLCLMAKYQLICRLIRKVYYKLANSMKDTEEGMLIRIDDEDREYKAYRDKFPLGKAMRNDARKYMRDCVVQILNGERIKVYELFNKFNLVH